jgi:hypothetical protein
MARVAQAPDTDRKKLGADPPVVGNSVEWVQVCGSSWRCSCRCRKSRTACRGLRQVTKAIFTIVKKLLGGVSLSGLSIDLPDEIEDWRELTASGDQVEKEKCQA